MKFKSVLWTLAITGLASTLLAGPFFSSTAHALSGSEFQAGRIIDDAVFTNKDAMTVQQIQSFLNSKVPVCWKNHPTYIGGTGTVYNPPFTCLKDYQENPTTHENNYGKFNGDGSVSSVPGGLSSAQIIWNAAQTYNINPQSLIVLLQKEQGLVTDDWPIMPQYDKATGYACDDSGGLETCASSFYQQVTDAAWQFRNDLNGITVPGAWGAFGIGLNNIPYSPTFSCGTKSVYIENKSTAVLYKYTPYTPNTAALANLDGIGDGCSAYGNRNFWHYFNDWFGSTIAPTYSWQVINWSPSKDISHFPQGESATVVLTVKNTGTIAWSNTGPNPVKIATINPVNRASAFQSAEWLEPARPALLNETSVAPGENGTFTINLTAPKQTGSYNEYFDLVSENAYLFPDLNFHIPITVISASGSASLTSSNLPTTLTSLETKTVNLQITNNTNFTWRKDGNYPLRLATSNNKPSLFYDSATWLSNIRLVALNEETVAPGQSGTFTFTLNAPVTPSQYSENLVLVAENLLTINFTIPMPISVVSPYQWQIQSVDYGLGTGLMAPGTSQTITVKAINTGVATWSKTTGPPIRLGTWWPNSYSPVKSGWLSEFRAAEMQEDTIAPTQVGTFIFNVTVPASGLYYQKMNLVAEGVLWFNDPGLTLYLEGGAYAWKPIWAAPSTGNWSMPKGTDFTITMQVKNTGGVTWHKNGDFPVRMATNSPQDRGSALETPSWISSIRPAELVQDSVPPGAEGTFTFKAKAPLVAGTRWESFNLVAEGIAWFSDPGFGVTVRTY
jgi:hypothetical protein